MEGMTPHSGSIQKNAARIAGMFDAIAPQYDLLNNLLSVGMDRRWRDKAVEVLQLAGDETMLDLCTGTADLALTAVRRTEGSLKQVVGIDFAEGMLSLGQAKVRRNGHGDSLHLVRLPVVLYTHLTKHWTSDLTASRSLQLSTSISELVSCARGVYWIIATSRF